MQNAARQNYLETEILTATPQKLQLMLIDAAIRSGRKAAKCWEDGKDGEASEAIIHAQEVVGELLAGLNPEIDSKLSQKVAAVYLFVFRSLMEATAEHSQEKLCDALRVLEMERETWRQLCDKLDEERQSEEAPQPEAIAPPNLDNEDFPEPLTGGFSLEA
jgi:flagellar protein FliS